MFLLEAFVPDAGGAIHPEFHLPKFIDAFISQFMRLDLGGSSDSHLISYPCLKLSTEDTLNYHINLMGVANFSLSNCSFTIIEFALI